MYSNEQWVQIEGFPDYEVSDFGRVRSNKYKRRLGKILTQKLTTKRYRQVSLLNKEGQKYPQVHRLVAKAFSKDWDEKLQVNHKDGDRQNNHVSNLEMVTGKQNILHAMRNGLWQSRGEKNGNSKLTEKQVREIKAGGKSQMDFARCFKVTHRTIWLIQHNKRWAWVQ